MRSVRPTLRKLARRLLMTAAAAVILLAIAVGGARLAFTQLPGVGQHISGFMAAELGLVVGFERIDVRFGLRGPQLAFRGATVASPGRDEPFLRARSAALTVAPWALVTGRDAIFKRLELNGTRLALTRNPAGALEFQDVEFTTDSGRLVTALPPRLEIIIDDTEIDYEDQATGTMWHFVDVALELRRAPGRFSLAARAVPPPALGAGLELLLEGGAANDRDGAPDAWRGRIDLTGADLNAATTLLAIPGVPMLAGRGDVSLAVGWDDAGIDSGSLSVALRDFALPGRVDPDEAGYDVLAVDAQWNEREDGDWRIRLEGLEVTRNGRAWPRRGDTELSYARLESGQRRLSLRSDFARLEDLKPFVTMLPASDAVDRYIEADPVGDVRDLQLSVVDDGRDVEYELAAGFDGLGIESIRGLPAVAGISGEVRADTRSGRVQFASAEVALGWPGLFRNRLDVDALSGLVVWRQGRNLIRVVSNDLEFALGGEPVRSTLDVAFPLDGGLPRVDIEAAVDTVEIARLRDWLPVRVMPEPVVAWLDAALGAGEARNVALTLYGALEDFPFDEGQGQFRVTADVVDAELEFVSGWPRAVDLNGRIEFLNAGFVTRGRGRVLGNESRELTAGIADMRDPVLSLETVTSGPLADVLEFVNSAPLIRDQLGPEFERLRVDAGTGRVDLHLDLPLMAFEDYALDAGLDIDDGTIAVTGFAPRWYGVTGRIDLAAAEISAAGLDATFLDGPVAIRIDTPPEDQDRLRIAMDGESTIAAVRREFDLPFADRVAGQTAWSGELRIPVYREPVRPPFRISVRSNLTGIAMRLPAPLQKAPADPLNLNIDFTLSEAALEVAGNVGASRRFALHYTNPDGDYALARGALRFGGDAPAIGDAPGLSVSGRLPELDVDAWLAAAGEFGIAGGDVQLGPVDLELADFSVFGQRLGNTRVRVGREFGLFRVDIDSEAVAGSIAIPRDRAGRAQIVAEMQRLHLAGAGPGPASVSIDPRRLPGLTLRADEFAVGARRFGAIEAEVRPDPLGLRLIRFDSRAADMQIRASGSWLTGPDGPQTRLAGTLGSSSVADTLARLGFDAVIEGESAELMASLRWPGAPSPRWMDHVSGDLALRVETGSMLDIEPGAGRVVGLMSFLALPRRLALDFRDVFNRGFVFDQITGDFVIIDGDAYTDNLKLTGPAAEIGVAGRTGLRDRDYEQQAVVTAEPGNMLPTVGGLIGGPGVGAALLIFTRIFKEPLKGIGRAAYCITGSWDAPAVERLAPDERAQGELCAGLPPGGLPEDVAVGSARTE